MKTRLLTIIVCAAIAAAWWVGYVIPSDNMVLNCTPDPIAQTCAYTP